MKKLKNERIEKTAHNEQFHASGGAFPPPRKLKTEN